MEDIDKAQSEALTAAGASLTDTIFNDVIGITGRPSAKWSYTNRTKF